MKRLLWVVVFAVMSVTVLPASAQDDSPFVADPAYPAPDFPTGLDWINVDAPLSISDLRGKIVVLDFWTYGCINCIHMFPVLKQIEDKFGNDVAIIGVHSAKFDNEGQTDNIRQIVQRYELEHPVINDHDFQVWREYSAYGVNAWPTFVVIDPRGNILAVQSGEIPFVAFDHLVSGMVDYFGAQDELNQDPLTLDLATAQRANTVLAFPGKVLADPVGSRLFISDTNNNRIVIADLNNYEVLDVAGSGSRGADDGSFGEASFAKPQGMALDSDSGTLYVADVENHLIRALDLSSREVTTIAGTGVEGGYGATGGPALETALNSPWDLALGNHTLYIAMAGAHQLWAMTLDDGLVFPLAGRGSEGLEDGDFQSAQLAQPSGLYYHDGLLYFADSESSSIRVADIRTREVSTLAGPMENNLFAFGDADGVVGTSRLQHTLGVVGAEDGTLYVADTYNSKIKHLDPATQEITSLFGLGGTGGFRDGGADLAQFDEPGGLDYAGGKLYVADTNNQAVRVIDLASAEVSTIAFPNPEMLQIENRPTVVAGNSAAGLHVSLPEQTLAAGNGEIELNITLPDGYKLNDLAPFSSSWSSDGDAVEIDAANQSQSLVEPEMPLHVPVSLHEGSAVLHGDLTIYYCEAVRESLCFIEQLGLDAPVTVGTGDSMTILLEHDIVPPQIVNSGGLE